MTMHTEAYCRTLDMLDREAAIRAIHEAWLQLSALTDNVDCEHYDNKPALASLEACLGAAGHAGFPAAASAAKASRRHVGGSLLASSSEQILQPITCPAGTLRVRAMVELDSHVLTIRHDGGMSTLAEHPNGFSCHLLAQYIAAGDAERAVIQARCVRDCGGMTRDDGAIRYHAEMAKAGAQS